MINSTLLIVAHEKDKHYAGKIAGIIQYELDLEGVEIRVVIMTDYEEIMRIAKEFKNTIYLFCLRSDTSGIIDLAIAIREYHPYAPIIFTTQKCNKEFQIKLRKKIRYDAFLMNPEDKEFAIEINYGIEIIEDTNRPTYLPVIPQKGTIYTLHIDKIIYFQKVSNVKTVKITMVGKSPYEPVIIEISIESLSKFLNYIKIEEHKNLVQCERSTWINGDRLLAYNHGKQRVILEGTSEEIIVGSDFREKIFSLLEGRGGKHKWR